MRTDAEIQDARHAATKLGAFIEQFQRAKNVLDVAADLEHETAAALKRRDEATTSAANATDELALLNTAIAGARSDLAALEGALRNQKRATEDAVSKASAQLAEIARQAQAKKDELAAFEATLEQAKTKARELFGPTGSDSAAAA